MDAVHRRQFIGEKMRTPLVLTLMCMLVTGACSVMAEQKIRITNGEWPPYLSQDLKHYGLASRIVTEAFALEGISVEYGFFPWKRAFRLAEAGEWDGAALWLHSPEREALFYYSDPVVDSGYVFFHLKSYAFDWKTVNDLKSHVIGATLEYNYGEAFERAEAEGRINVERVHADELNFAKLLAERIQIFPMTEEVGYAMLHKNFKAEEVAKITHHSYPLRLHPLHLLLSKKKPKNKEYIVKFNAGLKKLRDSGKLEQYLQDARQGHYEK